MFKNIRDFIFCLLVLLLPTQLGKHFWPDWSLVNGLRIDYLSPTIYATDILVILLFLSSAKKFLAFLISPAMLLFYLAAGFSFTAAANYQAAVFKFLKIIELIFLGYYVATKIKLEKKFNSNTRVLQLNFFLALGVMVEAGLVVWQLGKQASVGGLFYWLGERSFSLATPAVAQAVIGGRLWLRPYGTFSHPNQLAGYMLVILPWLWLAGTRLTRLAFWLGVLVIVLSFSQAAWLVGGVLAGPWIIKKLSIINYQLSIIIISLFLTTVIAGSWWWIMNYQGTDESLLLRRQLNEVGLKMISDYPLFGVGLNNFLVRLPEYYQDHGQVRWLQPAHNVYLLIAAETGLVGLGLWLGLVALTIKKLLISNTCLPARQVQYLISPIAILLLALFDHYFYTLPQTQLLAAIVFGLCWSSALQKKIGSLK